MMDSKRLNLSPGDPAARAPEADEAKEPGCRRAGSDGPSGLRDALRRMARERSGFTLIEIMVVVVIIGLLLTVVATNLTKQLGTAETVKSKADIQGLETALAQYRLDNGFYPTTEQGLEALLLKPTSEPVPYAWNGPYLKGQSAVPKDRWGNDYLYLSPGVHNPDSYDVWTRGKDGQDGGEGDGADIGNWQNAPGEGQTAAR